MALREQQRERDAEAFRYTLVPSCRLAVTLLCSLGCVVGMCSRMQTSFAVICMVRQPTPVDNDTFAVGHPTRVQGEFEWSKQFQGVVLSAYSYGYVAALAIGGWVADRYPSHKVVICSCLSQAFLLALIPEMTRIHSYGIVVLRALQGVAASVYYPSFNVILRNWSTAGEFALLFSIAWSGAYLGGAVSFPLSSALCQSSLLGGWPAIFYACALLFVVWSALACVALTESPEHHRFVSSAEMKCLTSQAHVETSTTQPKKPVSVWTLVTNLQVWIIGLSYYTTSWFYGALNITLPTFMKEGFNFDITENGFVSALPSLCMGLLIIVGGKSFEYLHVQRGVSLTTARKLFSLIGLLVPSACMIAVVLLPASQRYPGVVLISLAQGVSSIVISSGPVSAAADIAPQYIGFIWGLAASFGNTSGFLAPLIAVAMTPNGTLQEWRWFFAIAIVKMVLLSGLIACCWQSKVQPFARRDSQRLARQHELAGKCSATEQTA